MQKLEFITLDSLKITSGSLKTLKSWQPGQESSTRFAEGSFWRISCDKRELQTGNEANKKPQLRFGLTLAANLCCCSSAAVWYRYYS